MASHRVGGRKLSRKQGPRLSLFKNLTVSVIRYERVKTTEAKAKEISGRVEKMITLAKRGDLSARRAVVAQFPNEPLVVNKLFDEIAPKYADRTSGLHPDRPPRPAPRRRGRDRPDRACLKQALERASRCATARGSNTTERTSPGSRSILGNGRSRGSWRPRWPASVTGWSSGSTGPAGRMPACMPAGQVIAFTYAGRLTATELGRALDALLPTDVAVRDVRRAPAGFNPRYAARYREYRYTVWNGPRSPLRERTALGVRAPLDTAAMARAGSAFIGRHDFSAFGAADRTSVRTVMAVRVRREGRLVTIDVRADAFLRGMVRRMVAVLLEVGLGKMDETAVRAALAGPGPALDGAAAPAKGLCLRRVALGRQPGEPNGEHEER